ncbi:MAG: NRDE family protein [Alcaligenaceae bacterium]|nr:NRDE family protein [Alcaligenaceae bacterium]
MCIAYIRFQPEQHAALFIAANRDEFHVRPTAFAAIWEDSPNIIAGRDLEAGGTWLGINRQGGAALITNIRDPLTMRSDAKSRGALVRNALLHQSLQQGFTPTALTDFIKEQGPLADYNGFNLVFGDTERLYYLNNYEHIKQNEAKQTTEYEPYELPPGSYTLSNADLFTVWPKTKELGLSLDSIDLSAISSGDLSNLESDFVQDFTENIFKKLANNQQAPDHLLPKTGISNGFEKLLSSPFIISPEYGTRCSSIILNFKDDSSFMAERSFDSQGQAVHEVMFYQKDGIILSTKKGKTHK